MDTSLYRQPSQKVNGENKGFIFLRIKIFRQENGRKNLSEERIFLPVYSVDFLDFVAVRVEGLDDLMDVLLVVRLDGDGQYDLLEAVGDLRLVVV